MAVYFTLISLFPSDYILLTMFVELKGLHLLGIMSEELQDGHCRTETPPVIWSVGFYKSDIGR